MLNDQLTTRWVIRSSLGISHSLPSRVVTEAYRAPSDDTQPKLSPTSITSPGLIDLSSNRMMPLIRLDTSFCRPKPMPTPIAPVNTAKAVRSMPMLFNAMTNATTTSVDFNSLPISTWIEGVRLRALRIR